MKSKIPLLSIATLSFLGFADAAYLTVEHYFSLPLPCSITQGCDTVLRSSYAMVGPLPTSFFGVLYYLAILVLAIHLYTSEESTAIIPWLIFGLTVMGFAMSTYLVYLQIFVIQALCMYCLGSALISTLLLALSSLLPHLFKDSIEN